jgi:endonuclease G
VIGPNNVAVPTHFFKVVVGETEAHELELEAFVLPNEAIPDGTPLASFQVINY